MTRNAWIELDLDVLGDNIRAMQQALARRTEVILVVKANAYGHGMQAVARRASACGVGWFVVSRLDEALDLRATLPQARILLLGAVWPADVGEILAQGITPVLVGEDQAREVAAAARRCRAALPCHVKIDTGMGRFGLAWEEAGDKLSRLRAEGGLEIQGLCTHLASAGKPGDPFAELQAQRFHTAIADCAAKGLTVPFKHMANSAAFATRADWDLDGVRLGILLYGYGGKRHDTRVRTRPLLQWKTRVIQIRKVPAGFKVGYLSTHVTSAPTHLATIDVGYSDGYSRLMSNKGYVLVGGRRARVVGRVTMNFTTVDLGLDAAVREGEEVVLLGQQSGESLWADELARWCQTIPYEILTSIRSATAP